MQTFLPYPHFHQSAACLDRLRLGKQKVECKQIYLALTEPVYGWKNHPAVKMWRGYHGTVAYYGWICAKEWLKRGYKDTMLPWFKDHMSADGLPPWWGSEEFHLSHQSNLVRKDPKHYRKYFPTVPDDLPYVWPED
jgi:hypothetical protein